MSETVTHASVPALVTVVSMLFATSTVVTNLIFSVAFFVIGVAIASRAHGHYRFRITASIRQQSKRHKRGRGRSDA